MMEMDGPMNRVKWRWMGRDLRCNRDGWAGVIVVLETGGPSVVVADRGMGRRHMV
jgi:hypothetical protein